MAEPASKPVYAVVHLLHGGRRYQPGDRIDLTHSPELLAQLVEREEASHTRPKPDGE